MNTTLTGVQPSPSAIYNQIVAVIKLKQVFAPQRPIVFPPNGQTDITKFDISLHVKLLLELNVFKTPHFQRTPNLLPFNMSQLTLPFGASTVADYLEFLKIARNFLLHHSPTSINLQDFHHYWNLIEMILIGLKYDVNNIKDLKSGFIAFESRFTYAITLSKIDIQDVYLKDIKVNMASYHADDSRDFTSILVKLDQSEKKLTEVKEEVVEKVDLAAKGVRSKIDEAKNEVLGKISTSSKDIKDQIHEAESKIITHTDTSAKDVEEKIDQAKEAIVSKFDSMAGFIQDISEKREVGNEDIVKNIEYESKRVADKIEGKGPSKKYLTPISIIFDPPPPYATKHNFSNLPPPCVT